MNYSLQSQAFEENILMKVFVESTSMELHFITFPGSIVSQNDCRMWNKSYRSETPLRCEDNHSSL
jgi:phage-related protein